MAPNKELVLRLKRLMCDAGAHTKSDILPSKPARARLTVSRGAKIDSQVSPQRLDALLLNRQRQDFFDVLT